MCFERMTLLRSQLLPGWLYVQGHSCSTHAKLSLQNFLLLQFSAYVLGMYDNCYTITFHSNNKVQIAFGSYRAAVYHIFYHG